MRLGSMSCTGLVTSYGAQKGYGFISSDQFPSDVFFGRQTLPTELKDGFARFDLSGKRVRFEVSDQSNDGKFIADKVYLEPVVGERFIGQVKSYNASKGFGFIGSSSLEGQDFFFFRAGTCRTWGAFTRTRWRPS